MTRVVSKPLVAVAVGTVVVSAAVSAGTAMLVTARTPKPATGTSSRTATIVTAQVERRRLVHRVAGTAVIEPGQERVVRLPCADEGQVVTRMGGLKLGRPLAMGSMIAELQGKPAIALPGPFPWYRDLAVGDSGPDALQLNEALGAISGRALAGNRVTVATLAAANSVWLRAGYRRTGKTIRFCELVAVPSDGSVAGLSGHKGSTAEDVKLTVRAGKSSARVEIAASDVPWVKDGARIDFHLDSRSLRLPVARIVSRGRRTYATSTLPQSRTYPRKIPITIREKREKRAGLVVPVTALYAQPDGRDSVRLLVGKRLRDVPVEVASTVTGWAQIDVRSGRLARGDRVAVGVK